MRITDTWLERFRPRAAGFYSEDGHPGFVVRAFPSGEKVFMYRYQLAGNRQWLTIGTYGEALTLRAAHALYDAAREHVREGRDPKAVRAAAAVALGEAPIVAAIIAEWKSLWNDLKRKRPENARYLLENLPQGFLAMKAKDVSKRVLNELVLDPIVKRGSPVTANRLASLLKQIFAFAEERERIPASLIASLKKPAGRERKRKRVLSDDEIVAFWHRLDACGMQEGMRVALRLTLATGQRRAEIASMRWADIDAGNHFWSVPGDVAKNEQPNLVPLSPLALRLLAQLKIFSRESPYVLPSYHRKRKAWEPLTERALTRAVRENEAVFGIPHFTPHDLRRTCRTNLSRLKVPREVAELILNHKKGGNIEVYDLYEFLDEKEVAMRKWGEHLEALVAAKPMSPNSDPSTAEQRS